MEAIVMAIVGSSAFTAIINAVIELIKNRTGSKKVETEAIKYSLLCCLQAYGERLTASGSIDQVQYSQFEEMYLIYKKMNGDGFADRIKKDVDALPIKRQN